MREIKFRAWDSELKFMVDPCEYFIELSDGSAWFNNHRHVDHDYLIEQSFKLKLMQFTGLKDNSYKHGQEVYEGDIISETGFVIGNIYEDNAREIDLVIPQIGGKDWISAYKEAMERGLRHA